MEAVAPSCVAQRSVTILENTRIAKDTYRLRLEAPELARVIKPGQFVMVRPGRGSDPLLGRPFALYDIVRNAQGIVRNAQGEAYAVDLVYLILGRGTACLSERAVGEKINIWGPLGNGFGASPGGDVIFVAGGIGQTPFPALGKWWLGRETYGPDGTPGGPPVRSARLLYGVRNAALAAGLDDFKAAGVEVEIATDDGSLGRRGFVTDLLRERLEAGEKPSKVVGCGPVPMLKALASLVARHGVDTDLSLENHMACGFGACFSCVAPIRQDDGTSDLRRVCVEGPIFPADRVVWPEAVSA